MSGDETLRRDWTRQWFEKARHDIGGARQMLSAEEPFADIACFHTQQCAEKCLKGYLSWQQRTFEKTHDLLKLLVYCRQLNRNFAALEHDCKMLMSYAVEVRYPGDLDREPTMKDAAAALEAAAHIRAFAREPVPFDVP